MGRYSFFDAHLHPEGLTDQDLRSMVLFGLEGALLPARDAVCSSAKEYLAHFDDVIYRQARRLHRLGVEAWAALGIHPGRIPWHGVEEVLAAIPRLARRGRLVAIGEIGLERAGAREEQVFARQLELAGELNLRVIVGTPEREKARITRRALAILRESGLREERVLVAHANGQTLKTIRACGYWAGLAVNPMRLSAEQAAELIRRQGSEALVVSSNAGDGVQDIFALARTAAVLEDQGLGAPIVRRVVGENARRFLGLGREKRPRRR